MSRFCRRQLVHAPAGDHDVARGRALEPGDHAQGRGLAAARRAEQADDLAGRDVEIDIVDRDERAELLGDLAELDGRHGRLSA